MKHAKEKSLPLPSDAELALLCDQTGPLLHLRGHKEGRVDLAVVLIRRRDAREPVLCTADGEHMPRVVLRRYGLAVLQYSFSLPMRADAWYELEGERWQVNCAMEGDLRIAFVSCNGQEHGDRERAVDERNVLWQRLAEQHAALPLNLMLHGGDQIYADEILGAHPIAAEWGEENGDAGEWAGDRTEEIRAALSRALFERYLELYGHPQSRRLYASVPSLAMWDDHDICDGWGSLPDRKLDSPVGKTVFQVAREQFMVFQLGAHPEEAPEHCADAEGRSLSWHVSLPGLDIIAPDLRSERRRKHIMGPVGWQTLKHMLSAAIGPRVLIVSSVPALGPRLSVVESLMRLTPTMEKYEDDLRDQWQSRTHRPEWKTFLKSLLGVHEDGDRRVTVVSGEIHLATRATLASDHGPLHQLVASGITHPPPPMLYARTLGALARFGEAPLKDHPIRILPLPGQKTRYTARRNYLMLTRRGERWQAWWELDPEGPTPPLQLD